MRIKKLDIDSAKDREILLTYFFKKLDTKLDKTELSQLSCIHYDSKKQTLNSLTTRFKEVLKPLKDTKILQENVDDILKKVLSDNFRLQEELVRCDFKVGENIDFFYIAIIGVDFFMIEKELKK